MTSKRRKKANPGLPVPSQLSAAGAHLARPRPGHSHGAAPHLDVSGARARHSRPCRTLYLVLCYFLGSFRSDALLWRVAMSPDAHSHFTPCPRHRFALQLNRTKVVEKLDGGRSKEHTFDLERTDAFWHKNKGLPFPTVATAVEEELSEYKRKEQQIKSLHVGGARGESRCWTLAEHVAVLCAGRAGTTLKPRSPCSTTRRARSPRARLPPSTCPRAQQS